MPTSLRRTLHLLDLMEEARIPAGESQAVSVESARPPVDPPQAETEALIQELTTACLQQGLDVEDAWVQKAVARYLGSSPSPSPTPPAKEAEDIPQSTTFTLWPRPANPDAWVALISRWRRGSLAVHRIAPRIMRGLRRVGSVIGPSLVFGGGWLYMAAFGWRLGLALSVLSFLVGVTIVLAGLSWLDDQLSHGSIGRNKAVRDAQKLTQIWMNRSFDLKAEDLIPTSPEQVGRFGPMHAWRLYRSHVPTLWEMRMWMECPEALAALKRLAQESIPLLEVDVCYLDDLVRAHRQQTGNVRPEGRALWVADWDAQVGVHVRQPLRMMRPGLAAR